MAKDPLASAVNKAEPATPAFKRSGTVGKSPSTSKLGGGHTVHNYCAGGKVISSKNH